jgi:hypothetical protein
VCIYFVVAEEGVAPHSTVLALCESYAMNTSHEQPVAVCVVSLRLGSVLALRRVMSLLTHASVFQ